MIRLGLIICIALPFLGVIVFVWLCTGLVFRSVNKIWSELASELGCSFRKPFFGVGKVRGRYKGKEIEVGSYSPLGRFGLIAARIKTEGPLVLEGESGFTGIIVTLKRTLNKPQDLGLGARAVKNHLYRVLTGKGLSGLVKDKSKIKEALDKAIEEAQKLEG